MVASQHGLPAYQADSRELRTRGQVAAALAVVLEEVETSAYRHGLNEVGHFAGVASVAAWEQADDRNRG